MTDEASLPQKVRGPGTPDQTYLVPNQLQPAQKGPAHAYMALPAGAAVTDINPTPAPVIMQTKAN